MEKINIEATKLNNEDVIATSGVTCAGKYHLEVSQLNFNSTNNEFCYLSLENEGILNEFSGTSKPNELSSAPGYMPWNDYRYYVNIKGAKEDDIYYWDGIKWEKCNNHKALD